MLLELTADADASAALSRLKTLAACRDGRPRTQSVKIVWHDNPDHMLLSAGLALAEQKGLWRLERLIPADETWLPGQPAPVLAEASHLAALDLAAMPAPLTPLAAFEGRHTISVHRFEDQLVTLTSGKGILRSVTAERKVSRIWLDGDEQAVRSAALLIGEAVPLAVPRASQAAEAIALATGRLAAARAEGAPELPGETKSVGDALRHILGHLIDVILFHAPAAGRMDAASPEAVHQMRVAVRRARSALSIFRAAMPDGILDTISASLKALGSRLGPTRDWDVFVDETVPNIHLALPDDERLQRLVAAAGRRRREHQKALASYLASSEFRALGIELAWFSAATFWYPSDWHPSEIVADAETNQSSTLVAFADEVLRLRWKKLVSSGKRIEELDIPSLHGVRLRAKRTRYAAEMFASLHHGKVAHRFIRRLSVLQQRLGVLNDGAVATHLLAELGGPAGRHAYATGLVVGFLAARGAKTRPGIVRAFERFRRQPVYWD